MNQTLYILHLTPKQPQAPTSPIIKTTQINDSLCKKCTLTPFLLRNTQNGQASKISDTHNKVRNVNIARSIISLHHEIRRTQNIGALEATCYQTLNKLGS